MAKCPHCNYKLQMIDVRAECPVCGINIPNYRWEERLEEDAVHAEKSFAKFRKKTGAFKSCLFGNKFRTVRFVFTFMPLLFFLFPMFTMDVNLPFSTGIEKMSILNIILSLAKGKMAIGTVTSLFSLSLSGKAFTALAIAIVLVLLGVVAAVVNFLIVIIGAFNYHAKGNIIANIISIAFLASSIVVIVVSSSMFTSAVPELISVKLSYAVFIGIALVGINLAINIITRKSFKKEKAEIETEVK